MRCTYLRVSGLVLIAVATLQVDAAAQRCSIVEASACCIAREIDSACIVLRSPKGGCRRLTRVYLIAFCVYILSLCPAAFLCQSDVLRLDCARKNALRRSVCMYICVGLLERH